MFPIIGGRKVEQLHENIEALDLSLTAEQIKRIEDATPFDPGFPHTMIVRDFFRLVYLTCLHGNFADIFVDQGDGTYDNYYAQSAGHYDRVPFPQPITQTKTH